jgi:hypothetical protein
MTLRGRGFDYFEAKWIGEWDGKLFKTQHGAFAVFLRGGVGSARLRSF